MTLAELVFNPLLPRALALGVFGATGLVLVSVYSRRGPLIYPVYAALLAALTLLTARYPALPFTGRFAAVLASFLVASLGLFIVSDLLARKGRTRLVAEGRLPESALHYRVSLTGYAARAGFVVTIGALVSAGVAFIAA